MKKKVPWLTPNDVEQLKSVMDALHSTEVLLNKPTQGSQTIIPELIFKLVICFIKKKQHNLLLQYFFISITN
ncbi:MAG: hypothetical protein GY739_04065 [Mesoflavibacter sp.]|nr:hypothetical protein [Mesoflavibacter sp.]